MKKILGTICAVLVCFSLDASTKKRERSSYSYTLVNAVKIYNSLLENANQLIQDAQETEDENDVRKAEKELIEARTMLNFIGKKINSKSEQELKDYTAYAVEFLEGVGLDRLLYVLHDKREALKAKLKKVKDQLGINKENIKPTEQIVVLYPPKKAKNPEEKKSVRFSEKNRARYYWKKPYEVGGDDEC